MKRPRPAAPEDVPPGTVRLGGELEWFSAALVVRSDDLQPSAVTELLGAAPTESQVKGGSDSYGRVARLGYWSKDLKPADTDEWDIAEVVRLLFEGLPAESSIWREVALLGEVRVSLGLSAALPSQEVLLDAELLQLLASRHAALWMDIHGG